MPNKMVGGLLRRGRVLTTSAHFTAPAVTAVVASFACTAHPGTGKTTRDGFGVKWIAAPIKRGK